MEQGFLLDALTAFMAESNFPWAVCGGFALDLFLGRTIRCHGDIDLCVWEQDRAAIQTYILDKGWQVYEFRGQGKVRPLGHDTPSDAGRNLMCLHDGCDLVKFYPCEDAGLLYHQFFHTGMTAFHYVEFLFNREQDGYLLLDPRSGGQREMSKAILLHDGIPYLAPEIVLLYKASDYQNPAYQLDFEETYPHLNDEQKTWLLHGLRRLYPQGHPWASRFGELKIPPAK